MENDQESELDMLMSNELPEGEKQIKISSYFLFVSCQSMMNISDPQKTYRDWETDLIQI